jgi:catechol 2,3-dioxygenase-like lactoylglutathione lyase family enzyme
MTDHPGAASTSSFGGDHEWAGALKVWSVGCKVPDLDKEIAFLEEVGATAILEDHLVVDDREFRLPLLRWGDKYVHLFEHAIYEHRLPSPLSNGIAHLVMEVDDLDYLRSRALSAGATEVAPMAHDQVARFGRRDVVFFRSPGGILFELIKVHEHGVRIPDAIPGPSGNSVWSARMAEVRQHVEDLRADSYNGAVSRADRKAVFEQAFIYLTPLATEILEDLNSALLDGSGEVEIRMPGPKGSGDPDGYFGWWSLAWPLLKQTRNRFDGNLLSPVRICITFPPGWTHGHLVAGASLSQEFPELAWPLQIASESQVARYEPVLRMIAEAELHDRILQGTHEVIP